MYIYVCVCILFTPHIFSSVSQPQFLEMLKTPLSFAVKAVLKHSVKFHTLPPPSLCSQNRLNGIQKQ